MKSMICGEIHDSLWIDCTSKELPDVLEKCHELVTKKLPEQWPWLIVPLEVEAEVSPQDASWHAKKEVKPMVRPSADSILRFEDVAKGKWVWQ